VKTIASLLIFAVCAVADVAPPTIRDAFVAGSGDKIVRNARLTDNLLIAVCRSELNPWLASFPTGPDILLYLDGRMIKSAVSAQPATVPADWKDVELDKVRAACAASAKDTTAAPANAQATAPQASDAAAVPPKTDTSAKSPDVVALSFVLDPAQVSNPDTRPIWLAILAKPWEARKISVSAGTSDKGGWPTSVDLDFTRINLWLLGVWALLFAVALVRFILYARDSDIIRDAGTLPATAPAGARKAYSLGRTQMAVWTFVIFPALAFIFMVTWDTGVVSPGVLGLMGISFGTTLLAAIPDGTDPPDESKGFFDDLVSDGTGPSMHRYQMALFTIVLVIVFIVKTAAGLVMPDFDASLLALMGISNGTYIGFKMQGR